jgi:anaerobic dimethyl sulfoxide reductase subunit B (iron-sulfur subunit)
MALLIDYTYCTGCHTCEIACQKEHGLAPDQFGIKLNQIGPDQISARKWQYEFFPSPTERCDYCAQRVSVGKLPSCVKHCQAGCMLYGSVEELSKKMNSAKMVLFS